MPVADQFRHRDHLQAVAAAELLQLRDARHGPVLVHDLADHAGGVEAGQAGQVHAGFGLPGAHQHAALPRAQREDVAGAREVGRAAVRVDGDEDGAGAVGGRDAGGDAVARVDGFAERGAEPGGVARRTSAAIAGTRSAPAVSERQIRPRPWVAMKLMISGVTFSAAMVRSPSFSRSSSSTTTSILAGADLFDGFGDGSEGHSYFN